MKFFKASLYIISLLVIFWIIGFFAFLTKINSYEVLPDDEADAIVVLTGSKGRIDAGLNLLAQKYARHLFISGVGQNAPLNDLGKHLSSFPEDKLNDHKDNITLGHFADSTEGNAIETANWVNKHNYDHIILVTSNYHMPRSIYLFEKAIPDVEITPYQVVAASSTKLNFIEYNKFLLCLLK
jgi:uncharacterized SAM-binding protein YcdF (DUF218 family)